MFSEQIYYLSAPKEWAYTPSIYSYSSLRQIESCPLAWQLLNSRYDGFDRYPLRPNPGGVEGEIIHGVIEKLFRELAQHGMPVIGSEVFQTCVKQVGIMRLISELASDHLAKIGKHPRGAGFRLKSSFQEIHNKIIRIFKEQYDKIRKNTPCNIVDAIGSFSVNRLVKIDSSLDFQDLLEKQGVLTELSLQHPDLPFKGVIDFVWMDDDGVVITDFKSGSGKQEHKEQLLLYALLWATNTGQIPNKAYVVYPDVSVLIQINREVLESIHTELHQRIDNAVESLSLTPAPAIINESCQFCQVRQMCDQYWLVIVPKEIENNIGYLDIEITVAEIQSDFGFRGSIANGENINVVYDKDAAKISGPFKHRETLRILGAIRENDVLEIKTWTEVFHL